MRFTGLNVYYIHELWLNFPVAITLDYNQLIQISTIYNHDTMKWETLMNKFQTTRYTLTALLRHIARSSYLSIVDSLSYQIKIAKVLVPSKYLILACR